MAVAVVSLCVLCGLWASVPAAFAAGDINNSSCPFETEASPGFRSELPDCRAFELVSPEYVAGAVLVGPRNLPPAISPDGDHILGEAFGAFDEAEDLAQDGTENQGAVYEMSRTPSGWTAEVETPPSSIYQEHQFEGRSISPTDLGRSIWMVSPPGKDEHGSFLDKNGGLYILREGPGRFATVGPAVAPTHSTSPTPRVSFVEGVSADMAHIVFDVLARNKQLWRGDTTGELPAYPEYHERRSLYEYNGTSGTEPVLVGVRNLGAPPWRTPGGTYLNEGAELISDCGTGYDAISTSGNYVYFTATHESGCSGVQPSVNELYVRAAGSRTIAISEPEFAVPGRSCTGSCRQAEEQPEQRAAGVFVGASEDGSRVFFTSQQPLLDEATGGGPYLYEETLAGEGEAAHVTSLRLLAGQVSEVPKVAPDGGIVYFISKSAYGHANAGGEAPTAGAPNLYAYDAGSGSLAFVSSGAQTSSFRTTQNGRFLVFLGAQDLKGTGDTSTVAQVFEYDAEADTLMRVSKGQRAATGYLCPETGQLDEGYSCDGNTAAPEDAPRLGEQGTSAVAADGTVVFTSEFPLTPQARQGHAVREGSGGSELRGYVENVYEFRAGNVYLISPAETEPITFQGAVQGHNRLLGIDEAGTDIFLASAEGLLPQDTDTQASWYDARVDGGFPAPVSPVPCTGESCQGGAPSPPSLPTPGGTESFAPGGNLAPPAEVKPVPKPAVKPKPKAKTCSKGFTRKRNKCVRSRKANRASRATTDRRGK
jgi:hypothetical protein